MKLQHGSAVLLSAALCVCAFVVAQALQGSDVDRYHKLGEKYVGLIVLGRQCGVLRIYASRSSAYRCVLSVFPCMLLVPRAGIAQQSLYKELFHRYELKLREEEQLTKELHAVMVRCHMCCACSPHLLHCRC